MMVFALSQAEATLGAGLFALVGVLTTAVLSYLSRAAAVQAQQQAADTEQSNHHDHARVVTALKDLTTTVDGMRTDLSGQARAHQSHLQWHLSDRTIKEKAELPDE